MERAEALQHQEQAAHNALDVTSAKMADSGGRIERRVRFGTDPASAILELARASVDLLLVDSRAYGPVRRALVGNVSSTVVRHAPCPVLVTPRLGERTG
jgi:nucleotide-binding universal stress UspA family protein